jgi:tetratricopeptide (TPR) repeat protein
MKTNRFQVLTLAVAGILTVPTMGQYRVGDDGRALDANNRIGANGRNEGGMVSTPYSGQINASGNQIVTGNVTGGRQFRGNVGYTDPTAFRGNLPGTGVDRFISETAGIADVQNSHFNLNRPKEFYGDADTVAPPAGFVQQPYTGEYIPPPTAPKSSNDLRLGNPMDAPMTLLPKPGELILPGPVDSTNQQTLLTASPLYGVRQWRMGEQNDRNFIDNYTSLRQPNALNRLRLSEEEITQMRAELDGEGVADAPADVQTGVLGNALSLANPFGAPADPSVKSTQVQSNATAGNLSTGQGVQSRLLVSPAQQSTQYAELQKRLERQRAMRGDVLPTDIQAQQDFMEQVRLKEKLEKDAQSQMEASKAEDEAMQRPPAVVPKSDAEAVGVPDFAQMNKEMVTEQQENKDGKETAENATPTVTPGEIVKPEPLKIKSLAQGVSGKGLSDFLVKAEELMKSGKYTSALDQYEAAEQVAPNNPLVKLGRANAELGASYYARAEAHLREAFMEDPALLMGQYDLSAFLGQERLQFLVKDLKEIANSEKQEVRPVFLLAYLAYNTGNERQAAGYLELAERRAGPTDPLFPLLREYWSLPEVPKDEQGK